MKSIKLNTLAALALMLFSFNASAEIKNFSKVSFSNSGDSLLKWKSDEIDLGKIPQGKPVTVKFEFTNNGTEPVIISKVETTCGCTVADYSKKPILVNEKSTITATYNAANKGDFIKTLTVILADNQTKLLHIKGTVL